MSYTHHPGELQSGNCLLTLINSKEEGKALTKYYNLIVFLSWAQETCFLLRRRVFTNSRSPTVIISLTHGGLAPSPGMGYTSSKAEQGLLWCSGGEPCLLAFWLLAVGAAGGRASPWKRVGEGMRQAFLLAWFFWSQVFATLNKCAVSGLSSPSAETYNEG